MNKKFFADVLALALMVSGVLCGCEADNGSEKTKTKELVANEASDFRWQEITADDDQPPENIGGIMINGYVGDRTDIVIPKSIQDKPVVAIGDYAFCPYTEEDLMHDYYYDDGSYLDPEGKIFELSTGKELEYFENLEQFSTNLSAEQDEELWQYHNYLWYDRIENIKDIPALSEITSIMLPDTIGYIGELAFGFCNSLETIEIYGNNSEEIPSVSCYYAPLLLNTKLKSFNFYFTSIRGNGNNSYFEYCTSLKDVYLYPDDEGNVDLNCLKDSENINTVHIADGTTSISGITKNLEIFRDSDIHYIYDYSSSIFETNVAEIYLPESLNEVSNHTFCTYITTMTTNITSLDEIECPDHASVIIVAPEGSYAESYANENGISCVNSKDEITKKMKEEQESAYKKQHEDALALRDEIIADYIENGDKDS